MKKKPVIRLIINHISLLTAGALLGLTALLLVHLLPVSPMQEHVYWSLEMIEKEFSDEVLIDGYRSTLTGNFTDCLMLEHAVYSSGEHSLLEQVLHMYRSESYIPPDGDEDGWHPGDSLKDYLTGAPQLREVSYSRYWHGYLVFLKPLLLLTSFNTLRLFQSAVQLILAGWVVMALCRKGAYPLAKAFLISLPFLFFVSTYASLSLSICYYVLTATILVQLKMDTLLIRRKWYGLFFLIVGMATVYFDFLTYPLVTLVYPLGIYLYFHGFQGKSLKKDVSGMIKYSVEWSIGYLGMWAAKWILTDCLTGSTCIQDAVETIFVRTGSAEGYSKMGGFFSVLAKNAQPFLNWCYVLITIIFAILFFAGMSKILARKIKLNLSGSACYFLLALYPFAWFFLTQNHSEQHWQYTCRILASSVFAVVSGCWKLLECIDFDEK
ncbi:MAG: hypothetical protein HFH87_03840 [Lachnospiraceae bacterium]|nr:hypothetical protein [Lachnospiraceae bacterium]